ncbi:hypothetical protein T492DRAFT_888274 [Pavlovales sp. CCMP2436]|nr:hypothetical protein T492DRAFT_888274 [Pavlovales sp. CCMP2436]
MAASPTNDLDVDTLRSLEEALASYTGCAVIVSHDRWFLDRVCTHLLLLHGDGRTSSFSGTWGEYEEYIARKGAEGDVANTGEVALAAARSAGRKGILGL